MNNKKVRIYLMGGLGNNLSQLFLAHKLKLVGYKIEIIDYLSKKNLVTKALGWTLHEQTTRSIYNDLFDFKELNKINIIIDLFFFSISKVLNKYFINHLFDSNFHKNFNKFEKNNKRKKIVLAGYWQQLNIYSESELNNFKLFLFEYDFKKSEKSGLHVRGGDFLGINKSLKNSFYKKAIFHVNNKESLKVFSDDYEFSKKILPESIKFQYSKNTNSVDDFFEMLSCQILICSNSTFSIWAGLLSNAKTLIIPKINNKDLKINLDLKSFRSKKIIVI